jgi:hypothetical protein
LILYSKITGRYQTDPARCRILYSKATGRYQIATEGTRYCPGWVPDIEQQGSRLVPDRNS